MARLNELGASSALLRQKGRTYLFMKILFVHQNFPGQFLHLAPALARAGHDVIALTMRPQSKKVVLWQGEKVVAYQTRRGTSGNTHPWAKDLETKVIRGEACLRAAQSLDQQGWRPDAIVAHPSWGESLFLKDLWPKARLGLSFPKQLHKPAVWLPNTD